MKFIIIAAALCAATPVHAASVSEERAEQLDRIAKNACPAIVKGVKKNLKSEDLIEALDQVLIELDLKPSERDMIMFGCTQYLRGYGDGMDYEPQGEPV